MVAETTNTRMLAAMTPEGREMRFDPTAAYQRFVERRISGLEITPVEAFCSGAEAAEAALLAPSPCGVEGHRMCDLQPIGNVQYEHFPPSGASAGETWTQKYICTRCQELSRVRQQALEIAADHLPSESEVEPIWCPRCKEKIAGLTENERDKWLEHVRRFIPAEAQGGPTTSRGSVAASGMDDLNRSPKPDEALAALIESRVSERTKRLRLILTDALRDGYDTENIRKGRALESE